MFKTHFSTAPPFGVAAIQPSRERYGFPRPSLGPDSIISLKVSTLSLYSSAVAVFPNQSLTHHRHHKQQQKADRQQQTMETLAELFAAVDGREILLQFNPPKIVRIGHNCRNRSRTGRLALSSLVSHHYYCYYNDNNNTTTARKPTETKQNKTKQTNKQKKKKSDSQSLCNTTFFSVFFICLFSRFHGRDSWCKTIMDG